MSSCDVSLLIDIADAYLSKRLSGTELVRRIDDLVSNDIFATLPEEIADLLDEFQDEISLYVRDAETKKEASSVYFCDDELMDKVTEFKQHVQDALS